LEKRRDPVRRHAGALSAVLGLVLAGGAAACELPPGERVESARLALSYRTEPPRIAVGQHFVLLLAACPKGGQPLPERVRMDAHMPEHRHGMNYRPTIATQAAGRYRSEGWLFHMPGRWEFVFELGDERLTHGVRIE